MSPVDVQKLVEYLRKDADTIARLDERVSSIETSVGKLDRIVLQGDETNFSLLVLLKMMQHELAVFQKNEETQKTKDADIKKLQSQNKTAIIVAGISGTAAVIAALIAFAAVMLKGG